MSSFWPFLFVISFQCKVNCTRCLTRFCIYFFLCFQHIITFHDLCLCMFLFECLFKCSIGFFVLLFHSVSFLFFASLLFLCLYTNIYIFHKIFNCLFFIDCGCFCAYLYVSFCKTTNLATLKLYGENC